MDRNYLWLGCSKKFVDLEPSECKSVSLQLAFFSAGIHEIGKQLQDSIGAFAGATGVVGLKTPNSLLDTMSNLSTLSLGDESDENTNDNASMTTVNSLSVAGAGIGPGGGQHDSAAVSVFVKNEMTGRYELYKRLDSFTVRVLHNQTPVN